MPRNVYRWLRGLIENGEFASGERLDEVTLAERRGVSRTPLREAIRQLVAEGVVEHRPYSGNFIRELSPQQVEDLYAFRQALESLAIHQAVARCSPESFAELREIVERCHEALDRGDLVGSERADRDFHTWIADASGNDMTVHALENIRLQIQLLRRRANQDDSFRETTKEHRVQIVDALERGDAERAAHLMRQHIGSARVSAQRSSLSSPASP